MKGFPSEKELKQVRGKLSKGPATRIPPKTTDKVSLLKYKLCALFIRYYNENELTQSQMGKKLGLDQAVVNRILHYKVERITIDFLVRHLEKLYGKSLQGVDVKVRVKAV